MFAKLLQKHNLSKRSLRICLISESVENFLQCNRVLCSPVCCFPYNSIRSFAQSFMKFKLLSYMWLNVVGHCGPKNIGILKSITFKKHARSKQRKSVNRDYKQGWPTGRECANYQTNLVIAGGLICPHNFSVDPKATYEFECVGIRAIFDLLGQVRTLWRLCNQPKQYRQYCDRTQVNTRPSQFGANWAHTIKLLRLHDAVHACAFRTQNSSQLETPPKQHHSRQTCPNNHHKIVKLSSPRKDSWAPATKKSTNGWSPSRRPGRKPWETNKG